MCRILLVDDQGVVRELVAELLAERGHETVCADTPAEALEFLGHNRVDLAVVDLPSGGAERERLLRRLHAELPGDRVPVVLVDEECPPGGAAPDDVASDAHVGRAHFRVDELLERIDERLGIAPAPGFDRRATDRALAAGHDLGVHLNGMGPWEVVDVSAAGLGVIARVRLEAGDLVGVQLREAGTLYSGQMYICNRVSLGGGTYRYGLEVGERHSVLGRALGVISARLLERQPREARAV